LKILFKKIVSGLGRILLRKKKKEKKLKEAEIKEEIKSIQEQVIILSNIVRDQSAIIVSLAKSQTDLSKAFTKIESESRDENCFLIKIPMTVDETVN
jgi:hypothetical protein